MADLFANIDKAERWAPRLRELVETGRKPTPTDTEAIRALLDERNLIYELIRTVKRLRGEQKEVDRYLSRGIKARGLDVAQSNVNKLAAEVDAKVTEWIG